MIASISFDDLDSQYGGCTTHFTIIFLKHIHRLGWVEDLADYPLIVRLNPAIPWKTRGNAATLLRIHTSIEPRELLEEAWRLAQEYTGGRPWRSGKAPGVVVTVGSAWRSPRLRSLYMDALNDTVDPWHVARVLDREGALYRGGRGIVGAAAAQAALAPGDLYTFEVIAYRHHELWASGRCVRGDIGLVEGSSPSYTFNNADYDAGSLASSPGGWDPVLVGARGWGPDLYYPERSSCEGYTCKAVFRSNQHVDQHRRPLTPRFTPYSVGSFHARIAGSPEVLPGRHTVVTAEVYNRLVDLIAFREAWPLNKVLESLEPGDVIEGIGHVKPYTPRGRVTIALEKLWILQLAPHKEGYNPRCPLCGSIMKSMGGRGGFKCKRCGYRDRLGGRITVEEPRIPAGGVYTVKPGRYSHLSAPPYLYRSRISLPLRLSMEDVLLCKPGG